MRKKLIDGGRPNGFYNEVKDRLDVYYTSQYINMVKSGKRKNDSVLLAIIEVDHNWKQIEHERMKKML